MRVSLICFLFVLYPSASMADVYTFEIERAGYEPGRYDKKGEITYQRFIEEFRAFPWIEEIERWKVTRKGVSPTLTVVNSTKSNGYWVSMAGDKNRHAYLLGVVYKKLVKPTFGIGKMREVYWLEIYITE